MKGLEFIRRKAAGWRGRLCFEVGWSLSANLTITVATAVTGVLTARLLGPAGRGQLTLILLWPALLCAAMGLGFWQAFAFHAGRNPGRLGGLTKLALCCALLQGCMAAGIALALFPPLLRRQGPLVLRLALLFAMTAPVHIGSGYLLSILQGSGQLRVWNALRVATTAVYLFGVAFLVVMGCRSVAAVVIVIGMSYACSGVGALSVLWRSWHRHEPVAWDLFRPVLHFGARQFVAGMSAFANLRLDQLLMTWFVQAEQIGYYVAAVSLAGVLTALGQAFGSVTLPRVTMSADLARARGVIRRSACGAVALLIPTAALMVLYAPWLLTRFYGASFAAGVPAARILALACIALGLNQVLSEALRGLNYPFGPALAEMVGLVASGVLLWILLPVWGIVGAAVASAVSYVTVTGVLLWYLRRTYAIGRDQRGPYRENQDASPLLELRADVSSRTSYSLTESAGEDAKEPLPREYSQAGAQ